ncbi:hypothetical protein ACRAWF_16790 [Streptomyces sp. L7]
MLHLAPERVRLEAAVIGDTRRAVRPPPGTDHSRRPRRLTVRRPRRPDRRHGGERAVRRWA